MDIKRIIRLREKFKKPEFLKFVDFLQTLEEWVATLYETKRLGYFQKGEVDAGLPTHIFDILDMADEDKMTLEAYGQMKKILLQESKEMIEIIIKLGELKLTDFDWLQFNLYQIFGKEELASMVEWARLYLEKKIIEKRLLAESIVEEKIKKEKEYFAYITSLSQRELNYLAYSTQWDFAPSARTQTERNLALSTAYSVMGKQKVKFRNFEMKLQDATTQARRESQSMVFRKIGEVRTKSGKSAEEFRKKAKFIVSAEGPRKEVAAAKERISAGRGKTQKEIKESSKMFTAAEKMFSRAQIEISQKKSELAATEVKRRSAIKQQGQAQVRRGEGMIESAKGHMEVEEHDTEVMFKVAKSMLKKGKIHLEQERSDTEKSFSLGRKYLEEGKERMEEEQKGLSARVKDDERRIEKERQRIVNLDKALEKTKRSLVSSIQIEKFRLEEEREKVAKAGRRLTAAGKGATKMIEGVKEDLGKQRVAVLGRSRKGLGGLDIGKGLRTDTIQKDFSIKREKLESDLQRKKELLAYDVRFKQHSLQQKATAQNESMSVKFEDFQDRQQTLLSRHRATRKAKMVRTLLRAIREMQ